MLLLRYSGGHARVPKLTAKYVDDIEPPAGGPRDVPDSLVPGLYVSVKPSGVKSWCVRYRFDGDQRRYTIGRVGAIKLDVARKLARDVLLRVTEGVDPQAEKLAVRTAEISDAFPDLAKKFVMVHCKPHNRTWIEQARLLGLSLDRTQRRLTIFKPRWSIVPGSPAERWEKRSVASIYSTALPASVHRRDRR